MNGKATLLALVLAAPVLLGCSPNRSFAGPAADPRKVPKEITLYRPAPVLAARFEATDVGYTLTTWISAGAPTLNIDQNRAVAIRALDARGRPVAVISVDNPRDVHTAGAKNPDHAVLPTATLTVFFPKPTAIASLELEVRRGANQGYRQSFRVEPGERPIARRE